MSNCVLIVKKATLEKFLKKFPVYVLVKYFDQNSGQFILTIQGNNHQHQIIHRGFDKGENIHFTFTFTHNITNFFVMNGIEFSFQQTDESALNNSPIPLPSN